VHPHDVRLHLRYTFERGEQHGAELDNALFELLAAVIEKGSIRHAAQALGTSYRYVWGSLRKWEKILGEPLVSWSQGQKARPTQFAERLLWAERRARTRMQPHIEALRSGLARVVADARDERYQLLTVRASHDLALPMLQQQVAEGADLHLDIGFQGSVDALRALNDRQCLVAGFHVASPDAASAVFARMLKPLLKPGLHRLIACSQRMQGLMLRQEHAPLVRGFPDIARQQLRFVNRQPGSGTRMLVDHLMREHAVKSDTLFGEHQHVEHTHVAVALCIASGVADVGVGVEAAAVQFGLRFIPLVEESYFLACLTPNIEHPAVQRLRVALGGTRWRDILVGLSGYRPPTAPGAVIAVEEAFPSWWRRTKRAAGQSHARDKMTSRGVARPSSP
jgi:putative molybdopterin biosynthesis protein